MPELPEVETMRRGIAPVEGSRIERFRFSTSAEVKPLTVSPTPRSFAARVRGAEITAVERAGKRVVLVLPGQPEASGPARIVFEPRMTGLVLLDEAPPTEKHVRARVHLSGGAPRELIFWDRRGLGTLRLYTAAEFEAALGPDHLGPDALTVDGEVLRERLGATRRPVKVALLDQRALAGVGNIYAAEALHLAKVHPTRPCAGLSPAEWRALAKALVQILSDAVRYEGSTLGDGTYRNALNKEGGYQNHHRVYAREGTTCPRRGCGGQVERIVLGQRATFFCPACQG